MTKVTINKKVLFKDLGCIEYKNAFDYQEKLFNESVEAKKAGRPVNNYLLFCEHPHVFTLGKSGRESNLLINNKALKQNNVSFYRTNRGGDITYHGPGQIVVYPIFDLENFDLSVRKYIFAIEETIILVLEDFDIKGERIEGASGVWLDAMKPGYARKICAIGVKISRYLTMHGFAFNINTDLSFFKFINPCGFADKAVTSIEKEIGIKTDVEDVKKKVKQKMASVFGFEIF